MGASWFETALTRLLTMRGRLRNRRGIRTMGSVFMESVGWAKRSVPTAT
jgi:hypothetical protein